MILSSLLLLAAASTLTAALQPIKAKGSKLFREDGSQYFVKGLTSAVHCNVHI